MASTTRTTGFSGPTAAAVGGEGAPFETVSASRPAGRRREDRLVGPSEATRRLIAQASAASRTDLAVWIVGPPGADHALVARAVHEWGPRGGRALDVVVCSAVPEALQGREVFGCAESVYPAIPGAYAGALERATGGTLVLEDVDELRPDVRLALLRALAEGSFRREGESSARSLSARIVAASSRPAPPDLGELPHHEIRITPLRERREDILPLAAHYLASFAEEIGLRPAGFDADARAFLETEPWQGDARELRGRIREALRLCGEAPVSAEALLLSRDDVPSFKEAKRAFETRYVVGLLKRCGGNISRAARLARKDRKDFYDVIRRTGVDPSSFRS
jgi:two-component system, NtrC family, response regulator GlrR